jgi:hypothetical protein
MATGDSVRLITGNMFELSAVRSIDNTEELMLEI